MSVGRLPELKRKGSADAQLKRCGRIVSDERDDDAPETLLFFFPKGIAPPEKKVNKVLLEAAGIAPAVPSIGFLGGNRQDPSKDKKQDLEKTVYPVHTLSKIQGNFCKIMQFN